MKGKSLRSSFHCPVDRQPFMATQEKWIIGKKEKVSVVQDRPVSGRDRAGKKRFTLEVPEKAPTVRAGFALGVPEKSLLLGPLWV